MNEATEGGSGSSHSKIHSGQQGKHQYGHNNWKPGKSIIDHKDPQKLAGEFSGKGQKVAGEFGQPGFRERVDFKEDIGWYVDPATGEATKTSLGIIHHGKNGVHIVPARPN
jgi:filamentous hemagglutinin